MLIKDVGLAKRTPKTFLLSQNHGAGKYILMHSLTSMFQASFAWSSSILGGIAELEGQLWQQPLCLDAAMPSSCAYSGWVKFGQVVSPAAASLRLLYL